MRKIGLWQARSEVALEMYFNINTLMVMFACVDPMSPLLHQHLYMVAISKHLIDIEVLLMTLIDELLCISPVVIL